MSHFVSRVLVAVVGAAARARDGLPRRLVAVRARARSPRCVALHEFYGMARALRPLVLAGYAGALATLLGAQLGGTEWMVGGFMLTLLLAFLLYGIAETRQTRDGDDELDDPGRRGSRSGSRTCCCCATSPSTAGSPSSPS